MDRESGSLPPQFWSSPAVARALAKCDIPAVLTEVQHVRGWTQAQLAEAVGYSQSWVSKVLRGKQPLTLDQVRTISHQIGIPIRLLRFDTLEEGDQTKRRDFSKAMALAAIATQLGHDRADEATASILTTITGAQRRLEATTPARELTRTAVAHVEMARRTLSRTSGTPFVSDLCAAVSEAAGFTAWLHADMHDTGTARTYYRLAIDAARKADHALLAAYMLGSLATFDIENDDPALGLALLNSARREVGNRPPAIALAWLAGLTALGHATASNEPEARRALREAEAAVEASQRTAAPPWPWVFPFDHAKLAGYRALAMVRLERPAEAVSAFAESLSSSQPAHKQRGVLAIEIATARLIAGDLDEAFRLAQEALTVGVTYQSERVIQRARRFRHRYTGPVTTHVRAFDDQLRAVLL
ncbi:transcriptional regulator with XRE-family HTH domain [Thermocatellispora tengchongensis]|uniref:Transcriptional regulator with XRE-family HTH domain n=1 Tax=Thermocatellispora tengchongensis TaxID=1073253 RepID=A0A840PPP2_9ACTN|nr:helix-turn-helix transcriptional regulator [Thermocatellispora tengchongensis]MBB5137985.1 transcriptional regulator with XRE-family HTH domain [Thermocatellispora tengchongensis]